ncbi:MAG: ADP-glyceromanno-heptose 6-epimerase [Bacteroidia bacterium]
MIVVTGAEGFIGSCLVARLNQDGFNDLVLVDDFGAIENRERNLEGKKYTALVERKDFFEWLNLNTIELEFVFHIGARTDTTESDEQIFKELNVDFSKRLFKVCANEGIPLVYASSAATYGDGAFGYDDNENGLNELQPLNPYGRSKNEFDIWALAQEKQPLFWAGLKFFNVFGPNEYHKKRMASVIFHAFHQIQTEGKVKLFQSHRPDYKDGEQKRDFIYVKDLCDVCIYLMHHRKNSGIYNLGTGEARTWNDLVAAIFTALGKEKNIEYIPIPEDIREKYQYFTEANMDKLRSIGYTNKFLSVEDAVLDYVKNYLLPGNFE